MRMLLVAALAALVLAPTASGVASYPIRFPAVTALASGVAGHPVNVYCEVAEEWATDPELRRVGGSSSTTGYALSFRSLGTYAVIRYDVCGYLVLLLADANETTGLHGPGGYQAEAAALLTLVHEANHLIAGNDWNEGRVECRAIQAIPSVASRIGADQAHTDLLVQYARLAHERTPPEYRTVC